MGVAEHEFLGGSKSHFLQDLGYLLLLLRIVLDEIVNNPLHPYTRALLEATPVPNPKARREKVNIKGEVISPINPLRRCRFYSRCLMAEDICSRIEPELVDVGGGHVVACHLNQG
ncbi:hypothetical protein GH157_00455 [archaeon]|nr:hypothetical protein [archaeon]